MLIQAFLSTIADRLQVMLRSGEVKGPVKVFCSALKAGPRSADRVIERGASEPP